MSDVPSHAPVIRHPELDATLVGNEQLRRFRSMETRYRLQRLLLRRVLRSLCPQHSPKHHVPDVGVIPACGLRSLKDLTEAELDELSDVLLLPLVP